MRLLILKWEKGHIKNVPILHYFFKSRTFSPHPFPWCFPPLRSPRLLRPPRQTSFLDPPLSPLCFRGCSLCHLSPTLHNNRFAKFFLQYSEDSLIRDPIVRKSRWSRQVWELISTSGLMGDSVIWKTRLSGNINRKQTCPDKRIITVHV